MATTIGNETNLIDTLNNLIRLDFDAIEAYQAAINRLQDATCKEQLTQFMRDHERHTQDLSAIVTQLSSTPATEGDLKAWLTQGKVVIGNLTGDSGILKAMKSNEDDTNTAYEQALGRGDATPDVQEVLQRNLDDERRHRSWIETRLTQM